MNRNALVRLAANAKAWATAYARVKSALVKEGVLPDEAADAALHAANLAAMTEADAEADGFCPLCGRGVDE